jgi:hypothetical protein
VDFAIDFDRQPQGFAIEVENIWADRMLSAEMQTAEAAAF